MGQYGGHRRNSRGMRDIRNHSRCSMARGQVQQEAMATTTEGRGLRTSRNNPTNHTEGINLDNSNHSRCSMAQGQVEQEAMATTTEGPSLRTCRNNPKNNTEGINLDSSRAKDASKDIWGSHKERPVPCGNRNSSTQRRQQYRPTSGNRKIVQFSIKQFLFYTTVLASSSLECIIC